MLETRLISRVSLEEIEALGQLGQARPGQSGSPLAQGFSRRHFLKAGALAVGGAACSLLLPRRPAQAFAPVLIFAAIGIFLIAKELWAPREVMGGSMQLINESYETKEGFVSLKLLERSNMDRQAYYGRGYYSLPGRTLDTYEFSGPSAVNPGGYLLQGNTEIDQKSQPLKVG